MQFRHVHLVAVPTAFEPHFPRLEIRSRVELAFPDRTLILTVGQFESETEAYAAASALRNSEPRHKIFVAFGKASAVFVRSELPEDLLAAIPEVERLRAVGVLVDSDWTAVPSSRVHRWWDQNEVFEQTYSGLPLSGSRAASTTAGEVADIIAVASFFDLPLRAFLLRDTTTQAWRRRPHPRQVVPGPSEAKDLVAERGSVEWEDIEVALEHAHTLFLSDQKDYASLPARLRPTYELPKDVSPPLLLTYAGLLMRDLADKSLNGEQPLQEFLRVNPDDPGVRQPIGVRRAALYAKRLLAHALRVNRQYLREQLSTSSTVGK